MKQKKNLTYMIAGPVAIATLVTIVNPALLET